MKPKLRTTSGLVTAHPKYPAPTARSTWGMKKKQGLIGMEPGAGLWKIVLNMSHMKLYLEDSFLTQSKEKASPIGKVLN